MKRFFGILFLIGGLIAAYFAFDSVRWQHRANTDFIPTPAWIDHTDVIMHRGSKGHTYYTPEISYHYTSNGAVHRSERVLAINEDGDRSWAHDIVDPFEKQVTLVELPNDKPPAIAYVNPDNPDEAILVREYSFTPYCLTILSLLGAATGLGLLTGFFRSPRTEMAAIAVDDSDARLLLPTLNLRRGFHGALILLCAMALAFVPPLIHWNVIAHQISGTFGSWIAMIIGGSILVALIIVTLRRWSVSRHISDARLRVRPVPLPRGTPLELELEADAYSRLRVKEARCRVVCIEHYKERRGNKTRVGTRIHREQKIIWSGSAEIPAGEVVAGRGSVTLDAESPMTTVGVARKNYPYYTWEARVDIELTGMVDYAGVFPIDVM